MIFIEITITFAVGMARLTRSFLQKLKIDINQIALQIPNKYKGNSL